MKTNEKYNGICINLIEFVKSTRNYFRNFNPQSAQSHNIDLNKLDINSIPKDKNEYLIN